MPWFWPTVALYQSSIGREGSRGDLDSWAVPVPTGAGICAMEPARVPGDCQSSQPAAEMLGKLP